MIHYRIYSSNKKTRLNTKQRSHHTIYALLAMLIIVLGVGGGGGLMGCVGIEGPFYRSGDQLERTEMTSTATASGDAKHIIHIAKQSHAVPTPAPDDISDWLMYALEHHPKVAAAYEQWRAAVARIPQANALSDPKLMYGYFINEVETRVGPQQHKLAISQTFPWAGTRKARKSAAEKLAEAQLNRFEGVVRKVIYDVQVSYIDLYDLKQRIELLRDSIELTTQIENVTRTKYAVAKADHPDLILIGIERASLEEQIRILNTTREIYITNFNQSTGRREQDTNCKESTPWPDTINIGVVTIPSDQITAELNRSNPELHAFNDEIEAAQINTDLARRKANPDVTIGLQYISVDDRISGPRDENGDDPVFASITINLPIWREKIDAGIAETVATRLMNIHKREEASQRLSADAMISYINYHDARYRIAFYRDIQIPAVEAALSSILTGYATGTSTFQEIFELEKLLLNFQTAQLQANSIAAKSSAKLHMYIGKLTTVGQNATSTNTVTINTIGGENE